MNQRWTLHVENFARIESADIEIAPMMCFIGDNNSGKSYIMALLWGLLYHSWYFLFSDNEVAVEKQKICATWRKEYFEKDFIIDDNATQKYLELFNALLDFYKEKIVADIFNQNIPIGKLEVHNLKNSHDVSLYYSQSEICIKNQKILFEMKGLNYQKWINIDFAICWSLIMGGITTRYPIEEATNRPIYLPASRTGLLLVHKLIASKATRNIFSINSVEDFQGRLTAPYVQFLELLIKLQNTTEITDERKLSLIGFLQNEIMHGTIQVKEDNKVIRYTPKDSNTELPMSITSSVVTETASLLLLLTTRIPLRLVVIEEPEAHLHPALQKKIAQLLIRFVHNGIPIWITTHSDTILQHFNNMIKLNNRSKEEREELLREFRYNEEDLLSPEEINLYQFERGDKQTTIQKLQSGKYGFVVPSFNKAIDRLMSEIFAFQEDD